MREWIFDDQGYMHFRDTKIHFTNLESFITKYKNGETLIDEDPKYLELVESLGTKASIESLEEAINECKEYTDTEINKLIKDEFRLPGIESGNLEKVSGEKILARVDKVVTANSFSIESFGGEYHGVVIDNGDDGSYYDNHINAGTVIYDEEEDIYKTWHAGSDGAYYRIIYGVSEDGKHWVDRQMVLDLGTGGSTDDYYVYMPVVLKEAANDYKMWYTGHDGNYVSIHYATSADGINWAKQGKINGLTHTHRIYTGSMWKEDNLYKMITCKYDGSNYHDQHYATSSDGINWTDHGVVGELSYLIDELGLTGMIPYGPSIKQGNHWYHSVGIKAYQYWQSAYIVTYDEGKTYKLFTFNPKFNNNKNIQDHRNTICRMKDGKIGLYYSMHDGGDSRHTEHITMDRFPNMEDIFTEVDNLRLGDHVSTHNSMFIKTGCSPKEITYRSNRLYSKDNGNNICYTKESETLVKYINNDSMEDLASSDLLDGLTWNAGYFTDTDKTAISNAGETITNEGNLVVLNGSTGDNPVQYVDIELEVGETYMFEYGVNHSSGIGVVPSFIAYSDVNRNTAIVSKGRMDYASYRENENKTVFIAVSNFYRIALYGETTTDNVIIKTTRHKLRKLNRGLGSELLPNTRFQNSNSLILENTATINLVGETLQIDGDSGQKPRVKMSVNMEAGKLYLISTYGMAYSWFYLYKDGDKTSPVWAKVEEASVMYKCTETGVYDLVMERNSTDANRLAVFTRPSIREMLPDFWEDITPYEINSYSGVYDFDSCSVTVNPLSTADSDVRLFSSLIGNSRYSELTGNNSVFSSTERGVFNHDKGILLQQHYNLNYIEMTKHTNLEIHLFDKIVCYRNSKDTVVLAAYNSKTKMVEVIYQPHGERGFQLPKLFDGRNTKTLTCAFNNVSDNRRIMSSSLPNNHYLQTNTGSNASMVVDGNLYAFNKDLVTIDIESNVNTNNPYRHYWCRIETDSDYKIEGWYVGSNDLQQKVKLPFKPLYVEIYRYKQHQGSLINPSVFYKGSKSRDCGAVFNLSSISGESFGTYLTITNDGFIVDYDGSYIDYEDNIYFFVAYGQDEDERVIIDKGNSFTGDLNLLQKKITDDKRLVKDILTSENINLISKEEWLGE
jgi:hypothetical protein